MAETERVSPFFLCLLSTLLIAAAPCGGLTIELIHRHSPQSPFYQPNLTHNQRIQTLAHQSITRAQYLKNMTITLAPTKNQTVSYTPETVRVLINTVLGLALYSVKIGLGTIPTSSPPYKSYNLVFDTGSDLTWLQCEYCRRHHCFAVEDEPFPCTSSTSYKLLPCNGHPLCEGPCIEGSCAFERGYVDQSYVAGFLASETFSFDSSTGPVRQSLEGLVFGCTIDSKEVSFAGESNQISGVMGLGFGPKTFVNQLDSQGQSNGRFSYCLRRERTMGATGSFIRFGEDIEQRPDLSVTELRRNNNIVLYYINLIGISVNGYMLNIPEQEFEIQKDGSGGSIIDSGAAFSHIRRAAHDSLLRALEAVFAGYGDTVKRVPSGDLPFELCYEVLKQEAFQGFPMITFHLQNNADINLDAESAFLIGKGTSGNMQFYLAIIPRNDPRGLNAIGAYQQTNYRFIYDTKSYKLFLGPEDCFHSS